MDNGFGMPSKSSIDKVFVLRCSIPLSEIISVTTSPAPNSFAKLKNALFEMPAMGASTILLFMSTSPIFHGVVYLFVIFYQVFQIIFRKIIDCLAELTNN